jgi:hypothetical protein
MRILTNAKIHTLDSHNLQADTLVVDHGVFLAVGDSALVSTYIKPDCEVEDLRGATILPGLVDAHFHLEQYAFSLKRVNCETSTKAACIEQVAQAVKNAHPGQWIIGHGWNQNDWQAGFGHASDLDGIAPDNPVYLTAKSLHAAWVNHAALQLAGINDSTPDPQNGRVARDQDGKATGILFETAIELVGYCIPKPDQNQITGAIKAAIPTLWKIGLTGVHDFDRRSCIIALQNLQNDGDLKLRVLKSIPAEDLDEAIALGLRSGFGNDFLRVGGIKAFADGALGPRTAALLSPYEGEEENHGMLMLDSEQLFELSSKASMHGLSMAVHAIGDRANHEVLDAYAALRDYELDYGLDQLRHRIEHVQLLHPGDQHRLADLNIIASMQPIHAISDMLMADRYWGTRSKLAYAWKTQLDEQAILAFGSDAPVESPNPFLGIHAAVSRRRRDGSPDPDGWYPEQKISVTDAIKAYTVGPAYAAGIENKAGVIAENFFADLIVLDKNPFSCNFDQLPEIQPIATMVGGEWVYKK